MIYIASIEVTNFDEITDEQTEGCTGAYVYCFISASSIGEAAEKIYKKLKQKSVQLINEEFIYNFEDYNIEDTDEDLREVFLDGASSAKKNGEVVFSAFYAYEDE